MITGIQFLRSIGQFDYLPAGALPLDRWVLVYAENGRGKTTLAAILRSLATGDPIPIRERRRLAAANPPHAVLQCSVGPSPAVFENGGWNRTLPTIVIFDDQFVNENVYSGLSVEPSHRQHLHELVLGAQGVTLNQQLQHHVHRIEEHNTDLRAKAAAMPPRMREGLNVEEFCDLPAIENIDSQIVSTERSLAAAQRQDAILRTPLLDLLDVPFFETEEMTRTLERALPDLQATAADRVRAHFAQLGTGGEAWVADGMRRIFHAPGGNDVCPFCAQDLAASDIIGHYRAYFGAEYAQLKQDILQRLVEINQHHPHDVPARIERTLRIASERRQFWSAFCEVPELRLDTTHLIRAWQDSRDGLVAALQAKLAAPLQRMQVPNEVLTAIQRFQALRAEVTGLNERIQIANGFIEAVKAQAVTEGAGALEARLSRLRATRTRHSAEGVSLCNEYLSEKLAKARTERLRDQTRDDLEQYRQRAFPLYQEAINRYLSLFGAGFQVDRVSPADTRGGPTCNYVVTIRDTPIPIAGAEPGPGEPAFRNTLSSGDRNALALAFFFSAIDRDPERAERIVIIDDPISSLDEHRSLTTVQEVRRVGECVAQIIILSHSKSFLCQIWDGIEDKARCTTLKLEREGDSSNVVAWDVSIDLITEHDRNHALLRSYLESGAPNNRQVAQALRPVLEAFLRIAYPGDFRPVPNGMALFRQACTRKVDTNAAVLSAQDISELDALLEYAHRFHHNAPPGRELEAVNDGELRGFVQRVLRFTSRQPL